MQGSPESEGPEEGNVEVGIQSVGGEQLANLRLNPACPVLGVKRALQAEFGYPVESQQLLSRGTLLQNDTFLSALPSPLILTFVLLPFDKKFALDDAIMHNCEAGIRMLLGRFFLCEEETDEILLRDPRPLSVAVRGENEGICRALLGAASSPEVRGLMLEAEEEDVTTPLHLAAHAGQVNICRLLLEAAPSLDATGKTLLATDEGQCTALHNAAARDHETICRLLLEAAPSPEVKRKMLLAADPHHEITALHSAVIGGKERICRLLLEAAPSPAVVNEMMRKGSQFDQTPLDDAAAYGHEVVYQLLRQAAPGSPWK